MTDNTNVIKYGDTFYLKHESTEQYLKDSDGKRYNFPRLGNTGKVKLEIIGGKKGDPVKAGSTIQIRTTEPLAQKDILGAFADSPDCYYWKDYDKAKQSWMIAKVSNPNSTEPIHYKEPIYLTNCSYTEQKLAADNSHLGYITTAKNSKDSWILESTVESAVTTDVKPDTSKPPLVFKWSVASGDPTETSVILWTRINPDVYNRTPSPTPSVKYEVTKIDDPEFKNIVIRGEVKSSGYDTIKNQDYTIKVDVAKLEPNIKYLYRFIYADETSPTGKCKTLPPANYEYKTGESLKLAVLTCNDYSSGYFNALYTFKESEIDFVIHLGDFTYEYFKYSEGYGDILRTDLFDSQEPETQKEGIATTLKNFRDIHRVYYEDPAMQWAMANYTWIIMLDDHEFADNCYWSYEEQTMRINSEGLANPYEKKTSEQMRQLYNDAIQAWTEYIPARVTKDVSYQVGNEKLSRYKLYRNFRFGQLVDFYLTDSRSFRDKPELEKNAEILKAAADEKAKNPQKPASECITKALTDARKGQDWKWSMLGKEQKQWFLDGLYPSNTTSSKDTTWKVWGNQTLLAMSPICQAVTHDDWHGFKAERYEILQTIKERESKRANSGINKSHFVVFTGDMHTSMIAYLKTDFPLEPFKGEVLDTIGKVFGTVKSGLTLDILGAATGVKDVVLGGVGTAVEGAKGLATSLSHDPLHEIRNEDFGNLVGIELMTPSLTSPGISEGIYAKIEGGLSPLNTVSEKISPVTETASAAASYLLGGVSSVLDAASSVASSVTPDVIENAVTGVANEASLHKLVVGNVIKRVSPHIKHFDSGINGYAIVEFTPTELKWNVYEVNSTEYDKIDDGQGGNVRNVSTKRVTRKLVQTATYHPDGIRLEEQAITS